MSVVALVIAPLVAKNLVLSAQKAQPAAGRNQIIDYTATTGKMVRQLIFVNHISINQPFLF